MKWTRLVVFCLVVSGIVFALPTAASDRVPAGATLPGCDVPGSSQPSLAELERQLFGQRTEASNPGDGAILPAALTPCEQSCLRDQIVCEVRCFRACGWDNQTCYEFCEEGCFERANTCLCNCGSPLCS